MTAGGVLLRVSCPACGKPREGGPEALVYICRTCRKATVMGSAPADYPLVYAAPRSEIQGRRFYVPFWLVEGDAVWRCDDPVKDRAYARARRLGALAIPAFWSPLASYHDNLTLRYAMEAEPLRFEERKDPVLDGVRSPEILPELARLTWLGYLDRFADVTGVEVEFRTGAVHYAALPFFDTGEKALDGILGIAFPSAMFGRP